MTKARNLSYFAETLPASTGSANSTYYVNSISATAIPSPTIAANNGTLMVGNTTLNMTDVNILAGFSESVNNYTQLVIQNQNRGTLASADLIVSNDAANTSVYGDFGINSTISNSIYLTPGAFNDSNGTYAYAAGGSMTVGTLNAYNLRLSANNLLAATINSNGNVSIGTTNSLSQLHVSNPTGSEIIRAEGNSPVLRIHDNLLNVEAGIDANKTLSNTVFIGSYSNNDVVIGITGATTKEKIRALATGAVSFGPSGNSTGTFGQILTSQGNTAPPIWNDEHDYTTISATAGTYGSSTIIPQITIAANGRVTNITTTSIPASTSVAADNGISVSQSGSTFSVRNRGVLYLNNINGGWWGNGETFLLGKKTHQYYYHRNLHFLPNNVEGSLQKYPWGGGSNLSDSPNNWYWDKSSNSGVGWFAGTATLGVPTVVWNGPGDLGQPSATDWTAILKRYYYRSDYNVNGSHWSQREQMWLGESLDLGSPLVTAKSELVMDGNQIESGSYNLYDNAFYSGLVHYTGDTTSGSAVPTGVSVNAKNIEQATVQSMALATGDTVVFNMNAVVGRISAWTSLGDTMFYGADIGNGSLNTTYTAPSACTLYYHYWAMGDDIRSTFVKIVKQTAATAYWHTKFGPDYGGNTWYYYYPQTDVANYGSALGRPDGFRFNTRYNRLYTTASMTLPAQTNAPFTIGFRFRMDDITTTSQNILTIGNTTNGAVITMTAAYKLQVALYSASTNITTQTPWQMTGNDWTTLHFCWNPLDTANTLRCYCNNKLYYTSTTNPFSTIAGVQMGATGIASLSGFIGNIDYFYIVPEDHCARYNQGSFAMYSDLFSASLTATTSNGGVSVAAATSSSQSPPSAYIIGTYPTGSIFTTSYPFDYTQTGFALSCNLSSGNPTFTFATATGGFPNNTGFFKVSGTGIAATQHYYAYINYGDKSFTLYDGYGNQIGATSTTTSSLTFLRVNGGANNGFINEPGNAVALALQSGTSVTLTNNQITAFPAITFTSVISSTGTGANFRTDNPASYLTATGQDTQVRNLMNALACGKQYTMTGTGLNAASATQTPFYVNGVDWDFGGRGYHRINLNQNRSAVYTAATMTMTYYPSWNSSYTDGLDNTGGEWPADPGPAVWWSSSPWYRGYSRLATEAQDVNNTNPVAPLSSVNEAEIQFGYGQVNSWRITPPGGSFDSGMFLATSTTFAKKMYFGYAWVGWLIDYGTGGSLTRITSYPATTALTTQVSSDGINITTLTSGHIYRIVVMPIKAITHLR